MQGEGAAAAGFAGEGHGAAMRFHRAANKAQAQPGAGNLRLYRRLASAEWLEDFLARGRVDARAAILHADANFFFSRCVSGAYANPVSVFGMFLGIAQE